MDITDMFHYKKKWFPSFTGLSKRLFRLFFFKFTFGNIDLPYNLSYIDRYLL
jgi:hypothetical protein